MNAREILVGCAEGCQYMQDEAAIRAIDAALADCINVLNSEHTHCTCPDAPCKMFELNKRLKALGYSPEAPRD